LHSNDEGKEMERVYQDLRSLNIDVGKRPIDAVCTRNHVRVFGLTEICLGVAVITRCRDPIASHGGKP
jgi:hypothetical protein